MTYNTPLLPQISEVWQDLNWQPNADQQLVFQRLYELIIQANQTLNLTRITQPLEFWEKHLWDSLRPIVPLLEGRERELGDLGELGEKFKIQNPIPPTPLKKGDSKIQASNYQLSTTELKIIDIGTGAGFPGIPCAIALPDSQVTLLDSVRKKITFLDTLLPQLGIQNAKTLIGRAEIINKESQYKQAYDVALIRAVGSACVCAEYTLPLLKSGGLAILYRGNWTAQETKSLQNTLKKLGGLIETVEEFTTPITHSIRHCVHLRTK